MNDAASQTDVTVRASEARDVPCIAEIYAHHVLTGFASFEVTPPDVGEIARRRAAVLSRGLPFLVAEVDGEAVGYAYAGPYRTRPAYAHTLEDSVYIHRDFTGRRIGHELLQRLIAECAARDYRQLIAVIGDSGNRASLALHEACGFKRVGLLPAVGFKFGRWVDSVLMQRSLGRGDQAPPGRRDQAPPKNGASA